MVSKSKFNKCVNVYIDLEFSCLIVLYYCILLSFSCYILSAVRKLHTHTHAHTHTHTHTHSAALLMILLSRLLWQTGVRKRSLFTGGIGIGVMVDINNVKFVWLALFLKHQSFYANETSYTHLPL